mmetsp:Transcript_63926/g.183759  ORF Transcript_63926/g.183759 Transcript_63926/m.183759 type:complete len:336 (-) Transcript_63926:69-1076(-)
MRCGGTVHAFRGVAAPGRAASFRSCRRSRHASAELPASRSPDEAPAFTVAGRGGAPKKDCKGGSSSAASGASSSPHGGRAVGVFRRKASPDGAPEDSAAAGGANVSSFPGVPESAPIGAPKLEAGTAPASLEGGAEAWGLDESTRSEPEGAPILDAGGAFAVLVHGALGKEDWALLDSAVPDASAPKFADTDSASPGGMLEAFSSGAPNAFGSGSDALDAVGLGAPKFADGEPEALGSITAETFGSGAPKFADVASTLPGGVPKAFGSGASDIFGSGAPKFPDADSAPLGGAPEAFGSNAPGTFGSGAPKFALIEEACASSRRRAPTHGALEIGA